MHLVAPDGWRPPDLPPESPFRLLSFGHILVQIQVCAITTENLRIHLDAQTEQLQRILDERWHRDPVKVVMLVDGSVALMPPPDARPLQAQWMKEHKEKLSLMTRRMGFVLPNPWLRGFVGAVFFLAPQPVPMTTHRSMEDAIHWAIREMDQGDGRVDPELRRRGATLVEEAKRAAMRDVPVRVA